MVDVRKISKLRRATLAKKALRRMAGAQSPEQALWLAVVLSAVEDLTLPQDAGPYSPSRYLSESFPFEVHADLAGLEPDAVRLVLRQACLLDSGHQVAA